MIANNARCIREIKPSIAVTKAAFNRKKSLSISKLDLHLRKNLVNFYICSIELYGAESWTFRKLGRKYLEGFECGAGEGWRRLAGLVI
jgi:hypothetical protein